MLIGLGCFLVGVVDFPEVLTGTKVFENHDLRHVEFVFRKFFLGALKSGELPAFFPDAGLGLSLFANPHYKVLYPANLPVMAWDDLVYGLHFDHFLHYAVLGAGWAAAVFAMGLSQPVAWFTSLSVCASGIVWSSHYRVEIASMAWTGWLVWGLLRSMQGPENKLAIFYPVASGLFTAWMFLGGNPELIFFTLVSTILAMASSRTPLTGGRVMAVRIFQTSIVSGIIALVVCLPVLWVSRDVVPLTVRAAGFNLKTIFQHGQSPGSLFEFLTSIPREVAEDPKWLSSLGGGFDRPWYVDARIGIFPVLSFLAGLRLLSPRYRLTASVAFTGCLVLAMAPFIPGMELIWRHIDFMRLFRYTGKYFRYAYLFTIPVAAAGMEQMVRLLSRRGYAGGRVCLLLTIVTVFQLIDNRPRAALLERHLREPGGDGHAARVISELPATASAGDARILSCMRDDLHSPGQEIPWYDFRAAGVAMAKGWDAAEIPMIRAFDCDWMDSWFILRLFGITHVLTPGGIKFKDPDNQFATLNTPVQSAREHYIPNDLRIAVDHEKAVFAIPESGPRLGHFIREAKFIRHKVQPLVQPDEDYNISFPETLDAIRAGLVSVESGFALGTNGRPLLDLADKDHSSPERPGVTPPSCAEGVCPPDLQPVPLDTGRRAQSIRAVASRATEGFLVLPWVATPGWRATIDGNPAKILRANQALMALRIPAGQHEIRLSFWPAGLMPLLVCSILIQCAGVIWLLHESLNGRIFRVP